MIWSPSLKEQISAVSTTDIFDTLGLLWPTLSRRIWCYSSSTSSTVRWKIGASRDRQSGKCFRNLASRKIRISPPRQYGTTCTRS